MAVSALPEAPRCHAPVSEQDGLTGSAWGASRSALGWNTLLNGLAMERSSSCRKYCYSSGVPGDSRARFQALISGLGQLHGLSIEGL